MINKKARTMHSCQPRPSANAQTQRMGGADRSATVRRNEMKNKKLKINFYEPQNGRPTY